MEYALYAVGGALLSLGIGALYYWVFSPGEQQKGADAAAALQRAKAEGLQQGADVAKKVVEDTVKRIEAREAVERKLDPVDFANALIKEKKS